VCAVGRGPAGDLLARESFPTGSDPAALLARVVAWFQAQEARYGTLPALGVVVMKP
jgi:hypothetical protein